MSSNFHVDFTENEDGLHLTARGDFDGSSACELLNLLNEHHAGHQRVVIDTKHLRNVVPFGCLLFLGRLSISDIPPAKLTFNGEKGRLIAPEGSRVVAGPTDNRRKCTGCRCGTGFQ